MDCFNRALGFQVVLTALVTCWLVKCSTSQSKGPMRTHSWRHSALWTTSSTWLWRIQRRKLSTTCSNCLWTGGRSYQPSSECPPRRPATANWPPSYHTPKPSPQVSWHSWTLTMSRGIIFKPYRHDITPATIATVDPMLRYKYRLSVVHVDIARSNAHWGKHDGLYVTRINISHPIHYDIQPMSPMHSSRDRGSTPHGRGQHWCLVRCSICCIEAKVDSASLYTGLTFCFSVYFTRTVTHWAQLHCMGEHIHSNRYARTYGHHNALYIRILLYSPFYYHTISEHQMIITCMDCMEVEAR